MPLLLSSLSRMMFNGLAIITLLLVLTASFNLWQPPTAHAAKLPPALLTYISQLDPSADVRFDTLIQLGDGTRYLVAFPTLPSRQGISERAIILDNPGPVVSQDPPGTTRPDLVEFQNGTFLLKLIPASNNKHTLPRRDVYPLRLKEALFSPDLILPENLSVPTELKTLLGNLDPVMTQEDAQASSSNVPPSSLPGSLLLTVRLDPPTLTGFELTRPVEATEGPVLETPVFSEPLSWLPEQWLWGKDNPNALYVLSKAGTQLTRVSRQNIHLGPTATGAISRAITPRRTLLSWVNLPTTTPTTNLSSQPSDARTYLLAAGPDHPSLELLHPESLLRTYSLPLPQNSHPGQGALQWRQWLWVTDASSPKVYEFNLTTMALNRILPGVTEGNRLLLLSGQTDRDHHLVVGGKTPVVRLVHLEDGTYQTALLNHKQTRGLWQLPTEPPAQKATTTGTPTQAPVSWLVLSDMPTALSRCIQQPGESPQCQPLSVTLSNDPILWQHWDSATSTLWLAQPTAREGFTELTRVPLTNRPETPTTPVRYYLQGLFPLGLMSPTKTVPTLETDRSVPSQSTNPSP